MNGVRGKRSKERNGESQGPKLTKSVLTQNRSSFSDGKAVGTDWHLSRDTQIVPVESLAEDQNGFRSEISWAEKGGN